MNHNTVKTWLSLVVHLTLTDKISIQEQPQYNYEDKQSMYLHFLSLTLNHDHINHDHTVNQQMHEGKVK